MSRELGDYFPIEEFKEKDIDAILLPYQAKWVAEESNFSNATKSRRTGFSWGDAAKSTLRASKGRKARGKNSFYIAYEKDMTRNYIEDCAKWAKLFGQICSEIEEDVEIFRDGDEEKSIQIFRIFFNSGFKIEALSSKPRNMRSRQGDFILDEAAFVDNLAEFLKASKAMLLWGGTLRLISTYDGVENDYYELDRQIIEARKPEFRAYSRHFVTFLDAISQGLYKRICLVNGIKWTKGKEEEFIQRILDEFGDDADEELHCIPSKSGGKYFPIELLEKSMQSAPIITLNLKDDFLSKSEPEQIREIEEFCKSQLLPLLEDLDPGLKTYFGMDFARHRHLSYFLPFQEQRNLVRVAPFGLELRNVPYACQKHILFYIVDRLPRFQKGAIDSTGNGGYLGEQAFIKYGSRCERITLTGSNKFYSEFFPKYKAGMEDGLVLLPADSGVKDDHRQVRMIRGIPKIPDENPTKKGEKKTKEKRHGDSAIAGLLAWYATISEAVIIEFQSTGIKSVKTRMGRFHHAV